MRRRDFIASGLALVWPVSALAQQTVKPTVGVLLSVSPDGYAGRIGAFLRGLEDAGFIADQNVTIEYRWADGRMDRLPSLAADLVLNKVSVIAALGGPFPAMAAKAATQTIPVVFGSPDDPIKLGLVESMARPGGNITGISYLTGELVAKRLELLRRIVPTAKRIAMFVNPANPTRVKSIVTEASAIGLSIQLFETGSTGDIDAAFKAVANQRPDAILIAPDPFFQGHRGQLADLAVRHALPVSYSVRGFCDVGGLVCYGADINDGFRQVGVYSGRVLRGEKPADLPVVQATKFEFIINLKTAKALGLEIHPQVLATADEVIE
jgi:putative tryptophan/tyrosine transport system substrate-binding protein